jgi:hypothetical protein
MRRIPRRGAYLLAVALMAAGAAAVFDLTRTTHHAAAGAAPPAVEAMAALKRSDLRVSRTPVLVERLPPGMDAAPGTVRKLVSDLGSMNFAVYVWPHGGSGSICMVSTHGGGGCLGRFWVPFDMSVSDFDRLGAGQPAVVWGPVSDDVARVTVTVAGHAHEAIVENNVAFYEFPDASLLPGDLQRVVVTLRDGSTQSIRV